MDIEHEYQKARTERAIVKATDEEFADGIVQDLIEGRRRHQVAKKLLETFKPVDPPPLKGPARIKAIVPHVEGPTYPRHYDSQGYCDNPGRGY